MNRREFLKKLGQTIGGLALVPLLLLKPKKVKFPTGYPNELGPDIVEKFRQEGLLLNSKTAKANHKNGAFNTTIQSGISPSKVPEELERLRSMIGE